ncbi:MAG: UPF0175 family protein [Clostridia bacterium]|nr:UPF0175 family protein [Clostridia bacterium]
MVKDNNYDLGDDQKIILYAVGALDNTPLRSKVKLQKILFLVSNLFEKYGELLDYEAHLLGPYSETVEAVIEELITLGLIKKHETNFLLTQKGIDYYQRLKPKQELLTVLEDFKEFLNDLPDDEIMTFIYVSYPDYISESIKWDELKKKRIPIAISLLKKDKVSFSKAVEISGLKMDSFEDLLKLRGIKWRQ